jgi:uncharacterized protein
MPKTIDLIADARGLRAQDLKDWGPVSAPLGTPVSQTRGAILQRAGEKGFPESGVWECSPGSWRCEVDRSEFCHFIAGHCVYTHDGGETIEIRPGMTAWFPAGWKGNCEVKATIRKVYAIV